MEDNLSKSVAVAEDTDVVSVLRSVRHLIDTAMSTYQEGSISYLPDRQAVRKSMRTVIESAKQDIRCSVSTVFFTQELASIINDLSTTDVLERVHIEVVCKSSVLASEAGAVLIDCDWSELRVASRTMPDMLLVDGETAFSRLLTAEREALLLHSPGLVRLLHAFYSDTWSSAFPYQTYERFNRIEGCTRTKHVLHMLAQGNKDDVAARQLGMSVRTYRRYVADLMRELDAQSRFQVGVRAAKLGLMT